MSKVFTLLLLVYSFNGIANNSLSEYKLSINEIAVSADKIDYEYVNFNPSANTSYLTEEYSFLESDILRLNQLLFLGQHSVEVLLCDETAFSEGFVCLGRKMLNQIKKKYPKSKELLIRFLMTHELGHYLQDLHCKLNPTHVSVDFCLNPKQLLGFSSTRSKEYKVILDLHNGTDNYGFALLEMLRIETLSSKETSDLYSFFKNDLRAPARRINNLIDMLELDYKKLKEPIYK